MTNYIGRKWICGYRRNIGKGSIIHIGLAPHPSILIALHDWLKVPIPSRSTLPGVNTALFKSDKGRLVMATNMNPSSVDCRIEFSSDGNQDAKEEMVVRLGSYSADCFFCEVGP